MTRRPKTRAAAEAKSPPKTAEPPTRKATTKPAPRGTTKAAAKGATPKAETKRAKAPAPETGGATAPAVAKVPAKLKPVLTKAKPGVRKARPAPPQGEPAARPTGPTKRRKSVEAAALDAKSSTRKAAEKAPAAKARLAARGKPKSARKAPARPPRARRKAPKPAYLAAELGQPVDREGEPIGAGSAMLSSDSSLQEYALQLWRQMQSGGVVNRYMRAIERAGLTADEVWTAGVIETRTTSSTPDELQRYRQKLLFRANLLEAILSETVADLHRLEGLEPTPPPGATAAPAVTTDGPA